MRTQVRMCGPGNLSFLGVNFRLGIRFLVIFDKRVNKLMWPILNGILHDLARSVMQHTFCFCKIFKKIWQLIFQDHDNSAKTFDIYHDLENCLHTLLKIQDLVL